MKNVIAIIKNAWGESPPPKVKTGFILNIIGLTAFFMLIRRNSPCTIGQTDYQHG